MSNTNLEDVIVQLTETRNELSEEDLRLWDGLENERVSRIAGDDANKSLTLQVQDSVSGTERRLSTEVIHREQGDLDKLGVLNQLSQSLSAYRIKTDKEIEAERFARDILGINLDARITTTEASFNHKELKLYQNIQEVFTNLDDMYSSMDSRIKKYEELLQDITMDSIKITMDNGEINMGAWTILSQAREWDLEILTKMRGFQVKTEEDVNQALEEFQNQLPITENIINGVMETLSESPLIAELRDALKEGIDNTSDLAVKLAQEEAARAKDMIDLSYANAQALAAEKQALVERLVQESEDRVDAITREADIRQEKLTQEALDRSEEITERLGVVTSEVNQNVGAITERINSEIAERTQMIADQAQALLNESAARAAAISTQADALAAESLARRNALTAQADALNLEVTNRTQALKDQQEALSSQIVTTNATTLAALDSRATAIASDYNTKVTNLNNQLTSSIEDLETGVTTRLNSLDDEDGKLLQNIEAYKTSNNGNVAAIRSDLTTLSTAHGTTASKVEGLTASFTGLDGKVSKNTSSIATEVTARSNADSALGIRIDNLTASTSGKFTEVDSSITDVSEAVTTLEQATATRFTGLDSSISGVDDKADTAISNAASAQNTANTAVTTNTAQAEEISKLQGRLETTEGDLLTKASADVVSGIITDVSNIEGELSVQATSIEDLSASLLLVDAKAGTANTAAADAQTTANTAVSDNAATANRVDTLESDMTQVQGDLETKATASALELTNTEVTRLDGLTQTHSSSITDLSNELVTTNNNVTKALNAITIAETPTNQLPSWYWANHPMRIVNEVKTASVIGVTGLGTKVNLETRVYSTAQANGPIVQRVISATDPTLEMVRRSTSASAWSAWTQPLKAIKADIATKASSAALSSLDSKVTDIDGRVTSQATSISELEADLTETNNLLGTVKSTAASALDTANAAVTANDAQASDITQLQAKMSTAEGTLARKADANALSSLETKVDNNQTATATRIDELSAAITDLGEGAETAVDVYAFNALKAEVNTAKGEITSNTTAITDLGSSLNTLDNTVQGIEQETTANAKAIQDTSTQVSDIQGQVTSQGTSITNLRSDLTTAQNTANNAASLASTKADATAFNALDTKVTKIDGMVSSQASDITEIKADITDLDDKVDTKADSTALSALTTQVDEVEGKVTTNANALTKLGGRVSEVEGKVATKAEASALLDYYTKTQADNKSAEIAAGKVEEFSAGLSIGLDNLLPTQIELWEDGYWSTTNGAATSGAQYSRTKADVRIPVIAGEQYSLRSNTRTVLVFFSAANTRTGHHESGTSTPPTAVQVITIPANSTYAKAYLFGASGAVTKPVPFDQEALVGLQGMLVKGTHTKLVWQHSDLGTRSQIDANSTAIQNTIAEVSRVDDRVTATNSAQSLLEGRVETVEGEVTKKADASALTSLSTRVDTEEGKSLSQGNAITALQNTINHATTGLASKAASTAVTAVDNKVTAANGRIDTTNSNVSKLTGRVSTVEGAVSTKAEASALTALTTRVSNAEGVNTSQGSAITTLENSVNHATTGLTSKASSAALTAVDNKVTAANGRIDTTNSNVSTLSGRVSTVEGDVAKKADASALTALTTRVGNAEGVNTSQGTAITTLQNTVNHATTGLATKASTSALTATNSEVSRVNGLVTGHTNQLTQLASDITTINGTLETKANASALNDIYTKTQADTKATQIAAGEVAKYDAKLMIGGRNLCSLPEYFLLGGSDTGASIARREGEVEVIASTHPTPNFYAYLNNFLNRSAMSVGMPLIASYEIMIPEDVDLTLAADSIAIEMGVRHGLVVSMLSPRVNMKQLSKGEWHKITTATSTVTNPAGNPIAIGRLYNAFVGFKVKFRRLMLESATVSSNWIPSDLAVQTQLDANATAITNTNTEVARVDGRVTTESNRTTTLTGRVSTVEGNISKKADASALSSLDTRVGTVEGQYTSQASDITRLTNSLDTTNVNVSTAQTAAQNAMNAAGAKGKVIFGNTAPVVADRLVQNLWIDTTSNANTPKRWNGSAWVAVTDKVATDAAKAVSDLDTVVKTKANVSALNSLTTKVNDEADKTTANTSSITTLNSDIVKINNNLATKANASALSDMYTKSQADTKATQIAAGEIAKYDASLVIGGANLVDHMAEAWNQGSIVEGRAVGSSYASLALSSSSRVRLKELIAVREEDFVVSVKNSDYDCCIALFDANSGYLGASNGFSGFKRTHNIKALVGGGYVAVIVRKVDNTTITTSSVAEALVQLEYGTKATDWSPSSNVIMGAIDANATAIETTNAEVKRVDGRVTTESNRITSLTGRVDNVVGDLAKKADASALSSLTTRVESEEGKSTSQGNAITSLQNTVNHATTGLSTKASSAALTAVDNKVTAVDGRVNTTNSNVAALTGRVSTVEGTVKTKADVSAVNALTTRVGNVEGGLSTQAQNTTNLTASLATTDKLAKDALPKIGGSGSFKTFKEVLNYYLASSGSSANIVIETPITYSTNMFRISGKGYNYTLTKTVIDFDVSGYAYQSTGTILQHGAKNNGTFPMRIRLGMKNGKLCVILSPKGTNFAYPAFTVDATVSYGTVSDVYQTGWTGTQVTEANLASSGITNIIEPSLLDVGLEIDANANAISTTNAEVSRIDGVVKGHVTDIRNLTTSIAGKADSSALSALTVRVTEEERKSSTQASDITSLTSTANTALDVVTIKDVRATNQLPSWYLANYPRRVVNEFKTQTAIGVGGFFGGTYCNLETKIYYSDLSGGDIIQTATSSVDPSLYVQRRSNGVSAWTAWAQPIKDLRDTLGTKASASAVSTLTTEVNRIDGVASSAAASTVTLKSRMDGAENALQVQAKVVDGVKASYMVKMETNGVIGGFGLMQSTGVLGQVVTSFGVNANSFFIGAPSSKKQPFIVTTSNQVVNGVTYPAGTYIDVALIANATIGTAHIADASITNAKIKELDASKITTGTLDAKLIRVGSTSQFDTGYAPSDVLNDAKSYADAIEIGGRNLLNGTETLETWKNTFGSLTVTHNDTGIKGVWPGTGQSSLGIEFSDNLEQGANYVLSLEIRGNLNRFECYVLSSPSPNYKFFTVDKALSTTEFKRFVIPFSYNHLNMAATLFVGGIPSQAGQWIEIKAKTVKLEKGNKATAWTPSPEDVDAAIASKTQTFTAQPTTPYASGDIYRNGSSIYVCTTARASGSYVAGDWTLVGDVTANNKSADTGKVNGVAAATVVTNAANGAAVYSDVMSDLKITPVEKTAINQEWNRIQKEYSSLLAQAQALSITTTTYTSAYTGLSTTAPAMSTILASMSTTTTLTAAQRDAYKTQYTTYYTQAVAITKAINDKIAANAKAQADAKSKTFTAQPTTPYTSGDLWRNGATIRVCTVTRASGSYVAADWTLVGDVTSANTAANSNQLGGKASATVLGDITSAKSAADAAASKATAAENQLALWKYPNTTEIDGGKIRTNSVTANQISVANLSLISGNMGTIQVGTANIADLAVDTLKIKDNAVTVPIGVSVPSKTYTGTELSTFWRSYATSIGIVAPDGSYPIPKTPSAIIEFWEAAVPAIAQVVVPRAGGKCRIDLSVNVTCINSRVFIIGPGNRNQTELNDARLYLSVYRGSTLIARTLAAPTSVIGTTVGFTGNMALMALDTAALTGNTTYTIKMAGGYVGSTSGITVNPSAGGSIVFEQIVLSALELKK